MEQGLNWLLQEILAKQREEQHKILNQFKLNKENTPDQESV